MSVRKLDPIAIIGLLRASETRPRQDAEKILSDQVDREIDLAIVGRLEIRDENLEVCDLCGNPPGPGHEGCNQAISAGLD